ncbi:ATP-binding protein [Streptomyces sp. NPDC020681]|uniref:ATP-binding protein n=1 Tax=Streptomyces sp. NPDC020681 TaxID=3365083 RepID=UPI0037B13EB8
MAVKHLSTGGVPAPIDSVRPVVSMQTEFPAELAAIPEARHRLLDQLVDWGLAPVVDEAVLAADELLTNAVLHGCSGADDVVSMTAQCTQRGLLIAIVDGSPCRPRPRSAEDDDESGRGLELVDFLADRWGVDPFPDGPARGSGSPWTCPARGRRSREAHWAPGWRCAQEREKRSRRFGTAGGAGRSGDRRARPRRHITAPGHTARRRRSG